MESPFMYKNFHSRNRSFNIFNQHTTKVGEPQGNLSSKLSINSQQLATMITLGLQGKVAILVVLLVASCLPNVFSRSIAPEAVQTRK
jgi:hypothetical protein